MTSSKYALVSSPTAGAWDMFPADLRFSPEKNSDIVPIPASLV